MSSKYTRTIVLILGSCLLQVHPAAGDDGAWQTVYYEDFSSPTEFKRRDWKLDGASRVRLSPDGEPALEIKIEPSGPASQFANYRHVLDATKEYRVRAMVRAEGVKPNTEGRYNRGAVVFAAFLTREGKWVQGGKFAKGLHGDTPYQELSVGPVQVFPGDAYYVQTMLGLEGIGKASFDWVVLEQRENTAKPSPILPADGEEVATPHPTFTWESPIEFSDICVQLRRQPNENAAGFDLRESNVNSIRSRQPLDEGVWHWRILQRSPGVDSWQKGSWQSMVVSSEPDDESILIEPMWTHEPTTPDNMIFYAGPKPIIAEVSAQINNRQVKVQKLHASRYLIVPGEELVQGSNTITMTARSKSGATTSLQDYYFIVQSPTRVELDDAGWLMVDGKRFFAIGAYSDPSDTLDNFDSLLEAGFNMTHDYAFESTDANFAKRFSDDRAAIAKQYLSNAHNAGLKVFMGLPRERIRENDLTALREFVSKIADEPALLTYYLFDEPEMHNIGMHRLASISKAIAAIDQSRPSVILTSRPKLSGIFAEACDVLWVDPYPLDYSPPQPLKLVAQWVTEARTLVGPDRPVWAVIGAHDVRYWAKRRKSFEELGPPQRPTYEQLRCMTHLAIASGAKGVVIYWGPSRIYNIKDEAPLVWKGIVKVVRELRSLDPFLEAGPMHGEIGSSGVLYWHSQAGNESVVVLVNSHPTKVTVHAASLPRHDKYEQDFIDLAPHEVRVLRLKAQ